MDLCFYSLDFEIRFYLTFCIQVFGLLTKPIINWLLPPHLRNFSSDSEPPTPKEGSFSGDLNAPLLQNRNWFANAASRRSSLRVLLSGPTSTVHSLWRKFDNAYMRPVFGGRGFVQYVPGSPRLEEEERPPELQ